MKTLKSLSEKTPLRNFFLLILTISIIGCGKDEATPTTAPVQQQNPEPELLLSSDKQITSFVFQASDNPFDIQVAAIINQQNKTITATLPSDTPLTNLTPVLLISEKASINLTGAQDFTTPVTYTLTAEDGTTSSYTATVISNSSAKQITSFRFTGLENNGVIIDIPGEIDEEGKTIAIEMPSGTEITALEPELEIPDKAVYEPTGPQDFSTPINYTVTAEDGTSRTYLVTVDVALRQKEILLLISTANPGNTLNWNETDDLSDWSLVLLDGNGDITFLDLAFQNLSILPPEIGQLGSLKNLDLSGNNLTSLLPEIGQLSSLKGLGLGNNELSSLPPEIGQLGSLESLGLRGNQLSSLPIEIKQLVNLSLLDLRENKLSEFNHVPFIPSGGIINILGCATETNLEVLRLSGNPDLEVLNQCICDLDLDKGGTVAIDVVPDGVNCVGNTVLGN